jgi:hypothetical protein
LMSLSSRANCLNCSQPGSDNKLFCLEYTGQNTGLLTAITLNGIYVVSTSSHST